MQKILLITLIFVSSILLSGCDTKPEVTQVPAIPVIASSPVVKDITVYLESIGTLYPSVFMEIRPQASGRLQEVFVNEGQWVVQGTPLFQIDPQPYSIKVQEAEALLAIDQANFRAIQKKMARYKSLVQKDLIAQTEWDDLEAQAEKARASVQLDKARLNSAKVDLENCTLKSSIEGRVGKLDVHPGLLVTHGQIAPLATVAKMDPLIVEFSVTEKEFAKLPQDSLRVEMTSLCSVESPEKTAAVTFLDNHFEPTTGLLLVRGKVQNSEHCLRPGQSMRIRIPVAVTSNAKLIPQKAIRYNQEGPFIYVIGEDMAVSIRQLVLGKEEGSDQIVLEGLEPNERIILEGHLRLSPGIKVEVKS